jgi:hypothetical protein
VVFAGSTLERREDGDHGRRVWRVYSHILREHAAGVGDIFAQAVNGSC